MPTATVNIDKVRQLRGQLKEGLINTKEIDQFLESIELQLPENKTKKIEPVFHNSKLMNRKAYFKSLE